MSDTNPEPVAPSVVEYEQLCGRADLLRLLAQLFDHPLTAEAIEALADSGLLAEMVDEEAASALIGADEKLLEELAVAHTAIFSGPGVHIRPYASIHHPRGERKGVLWGDATVWFRRFALDHGLSFEGSGYHGVPDAIGVELDVCATLVRREAELLNAAETARVEAMRGSLATLLGVHMVPWVTPFAAKVREFVPMLECVPVRAFYAGLVGLVLDLLQAEAMRVGGDDAQAQA